MEAFVVGRYGSKDGLQMREMPEPGIGERDVLVQVRAASVNLLDAKIRDGEFKLVLPYRVPFVLGNDMAGLVVRVGSAVRSFAPGAEVPASHGRSARIPSSASRRCCSAAGRGCGPGDATCGTRSCS